MQTIVELNLDEIAAVTGGVKTATVSTAVVRPTLTASTVNSATLMKPALAMSTQSTLTAYRY